MDTILSSSKEIIQNLPYNHERKLISSLENFSSTTQPISPPSDKSNGKSNDADDGSHNTNNYMELRYTRFNDLLIICERFDTRAVKDIYRKYVPTVILVPTPLKYEFIDFSYYCEYGVKYMYINEAARSICPPIINGTIHGTNVVTVVIHNKKKYFLLVKDRKKKRLVNPGGSKLSITESFVECALREVKEETGLSIGHLTKIKDVVYETEYFGLTFKILTRVYSTEIELDDIDKLLTFSNAEIKNVELIEFNHLEKHKYRITSDTFNYCNELGFYYQ